MFDVSLYDISLHTAYYLIALKATVEWVLLRGPRSCFLEQETWLTLLQPTWPYSGQVVLAGGPKCWTSMKTNCIVDTTIQGKRNHLYLFIPFLSRHKWLTKWDSVRTSFNISDQLTKLSCQHYPSSSVVYKIYFIIKKVQIYCFGKIFIIL